MINYIGAENAANMRAAWVFFSRVIHQWLRGAHTVNLLVKDILSYRTMLSI